MAGVTIGAAHAEVAVDEDPVAATTEESALSSESDISLSLLHVSPSLFIKARGRNQGRGI